MHFRLFLFKVHINENIHNILFHYCCLQILNINVVRVNYCLESLINLTFDHICLFVCSVFCISPYDDQFLLCLVLVATLPANVSVRLLYILPVCVFIFALLDVSLDHCPTYHSTAVDAEIPCGRCQPRTEIGEA